MVRFSTTWYYMNGDALLETVHPYCKGRKGIVFISDPQLRGVQDFKTAAETVKGGGIMTGTVEKGSESSSLSAGLMLIQVKLYPVLHQRDNFLHALGSVEIVRGLLTDNGKQRLYLVRKGLGL